MPLIHGQDIGAAHVERETSSWDAVLFARLCNAIAWALSWKTSQFLPAFTERVIVRDNGIDAEWEGELSADQEGASQFLRAGINVFQYKKREVAAAQRRTIVSGLATELKGAVRDVETRAGKKLSSYVLFTNVDLTTAEADRLKTEIREGIATGQVHVEIVGAAQLAAMLNDLPHLRSAFFVTSAFRTWGESWDAHQVSAFSKTEFVGRTELLGTLREWLDDDQIRVIAISGTHMMGKTRIALESAREHDVAFVESLDRRGINIDQLRRLTSAGRTVLALINDPDPKIATELTKDALSVDGLKLIFSMPTADNAPAPDFGLDKRVRAVALAPLSEQESEALLKGAGAIFDYSLSSWVVENAGGVPGVILAAAQLGAELRRGGDSFLDQVARGFEKRAGEILSEPEQTALRVLSLMSHVGVADQPMSEAQTLCEKFGVELHTLLEAIERLQAAGFIRLDGSYAEVMPPPLANRLASRMLRGRGVIITECLEALPEPARVRFLRRLSVLTGAESQRFWSDLLGENGPFTTLAGVQGNSRLFGFAASAKPVDVASLLRRLLEVSSVDDRLAIAGDDRRNLFNAAEEMLFDEGASEDALWSLGLLAEAENETWNNNSTGIFEAAFFPLHSQVPLRLDRRLAILRAFLEPSKGEAIATLAVEAAAATIQGQSHILRRSSSARPLGRTPEMTYGDVWDYQSDCMDLLMAATSDPRPKVRKRAGEKAPGSLASFVSLGHAERGMPHLTC